MPSHVIPRGDSWMLSDGQIVLFSYNLSKVILNRTADLPGRYAHLKLC
jgi:hypothetical protein